MQLNDNNQVKSRIVHPARMHTHTHTHEHTHTHTHTHFFHPCGKLCSTKIVFIKCRYLLFWFFNKRNLWTSWGTASRIRNILCQGVN